MKTAAACLLPLFLAACGATYMVPPAELPSGGTAVPVAVQAYPSGSARSVADFSRVASRVEPVAEAFCREENAGAPAAWCDYRIRLNTDPRMPPNAYQSQGNDGRPNITVGVTLLAEMRTDDEIAFVLGHEASHHIAGHLPKQQQQQMLGAILMGGIVAAAGSSSGGASDQAIQQAMDVGAYLGARSYSQTYELEADTLGAFITARAGYDPERGAQIFLRPVMASAGGPAILSSHPASARRQATVSAVAADIRRQRASGLTPRPGQAG
jgi:Zn-dependent protease with chaperone function